MPCAQPLIKGTRAVGHMRPHYEDVRPQSEDAPAISQPLRDIAPPIYRWKGNGVTFQMSHQGVQTKKVFMLFARAELFHGSRRPSTEPPSRHRCALAEGRRRSPFRPKPPERSYLRCQQGAVLTQSRHLSTDRVRKLS